MDYTRDARGSLCFASGQGGAEEKNQGWGRAGQGREQNPRGGPRTVEPYQGILRVGQKDHKPISSGQCLFFNKYDFFCLFLSFFYPPPGALS